MELYGCHNKPIFNYLHINHFVYMPDGTVHHRNELIPHTMTKECQWSKTHASDRCDGCSKKAQ